MTAITMPNAYGELVEQATLRIERLLPGPVERVWAYLTDSDLRRKWLAAGDMELRLGAPFTLTWRNSELTDPPGERPEGFGEEHSLASEITELELNRRLSFTWGSTGGVTIELRPQGDKVLLTVIHRRLPDRAMTLMVGAGWHAHLDILAARISGAAPEPFWDSWSKLKGDYDRRFAAQAS